MTSTDNLVRDHLQTLADTVLTDPPPLEELFNRAPAARRHRRPPRRVAMAAGVTGAILISGVVAAAAGALPSGIAELLDVGQEGVQLESGELFAQYRTAAGVDYELWLAPTVSGGTCATMVVADTVESNVVSCIEPGMTSSSDEFRFGATADGGGQRAAWGVAPTSASEVRVDFVDGAEIVASVTNGRFFAVIDHAMPCVSASACQIVDAVALDADGIEVDRATD